MIRLRRIRSAEHLGGFTGPAFQAKLEKLLLCYYDEGCTGLVDFKPKARQIWPQAKALLKRESADKCAYCEADTSVVAHGDVEHFRPKSAYWWLAYSLDNYTFSCQVCNQIHKGDRFPIAGPKLAQPRLPAAAPSDGIQRAKLAARLCPDPAKTTDAALKRRLAGEGAHLPHPYLQDPEALLAWSVNADTEELAVIARDSSEPAQRAFEAVRNVLGLNRTELLRLRWIHYDELETLALALQEGQFSNDQRLKLLTKLRRQAGNDRPFAAMKRFYLRAWGLLDD